MELKTRIGRDVLALKPGIREAAMVIISFASSLAVCRSLGVQLIIVAQGVWTASTVWRTKLPQHQAPKANGKGPKLCQNDPQLCGIKKPSRLFFCSCSSFCSQNFELTSRSDY